MKKFSSYLFLLLVMSYPTVSWSASDQEIIKNNFLYEVGSFVTKLLNNPTFNRFTLALMFAFLFFVLVKELIHFIWNGFDIERIIESALWCFFAFGLLNLYNPILTAFWNAGQEIGNIVQEVAIGNSDPFFLPSWTMKTIDSLILPDTSIWDSVVVILTGIVWAIVSSLLNFVMWLAALYSVFGYALAKMLGLLFIPFIILQGTRPFFDAWLRFFTGFIILSILLRMTAVLLALLVKAQLSAVATFDSNWNIESAVSLSLNSGFLTNCISTGFVGIIFVLSSFSFSSQLGAGIGSGAGGVSRGISSIAKFISRKIG